LRKKAAKKNDLTAKSHKQGWKSAGGC